MSHYLTPKTYETIPPLLRLSVLRHVRAGMLDRSTILAS